MFVKRSEIDDILNKIKSLEIELECAQVVNADHEDKINGLSTKVNYYVRQLECSHDSFDYRGLFIGYEIAGYNKVCNKCDKKLGFVGEKEKAKQEYEAAKAEYNRVCGN